MDVTQIPFNTFLGITRGNTSDGALFQLQDAPKYTNHVNSVHASAQFALGEAASGECLLQRFQQIAEQETLLPVVRRVDVKYKKPAQGAIRAFASISDETAAQTLDALTHKRRAIIPVSVTVKDSGENTTMTATYEWFVQIL